jgi:hypothetical protein
MPRIARRIDERRRARLARAGDSRHARPGMIGGERNSNCRRVRDVGVEGSNPFFEITCPLKAAERSGALLEQLHGSGRSRPNPVLWLR